MVLSEIGTTDAVCAFSEPQSLNGKFLTVAFDIPKEDYAKSYTVGITCTLTNEGETIGNYSATSTITVRVPAIGISLDAGSVSLDLSGSGTAKVTASVTPGDYTDTLTWTSANTGAATVSNGTITAVGVGNTTITAQAGTVSAVCQVSVTCTHAGKQEIPAKSPSCTASGNNKYYSCESCGAVLKADGVTQTTVEAETLQKLEHSFSNTLTSDAAQHYYLCTSCGTEKKDAAAHNLEWVVEKEATAQENGSRYEHCADCNYRTGKTEVIPHTHDVVFHAGVDATCSKEGTKAYYTCKSSLCANKKYGCMGGRNPVGPSGTCVCPGISDPEPGILPKDTGVLYHN